MPQRILTVDDDPKILKILQHSLGKEGFEVITASSGEEALQKARQSSPDLVILDLMMPGMDGFETYQKLKAQREVPIIILSARTEEVDRVVGFRMGVDDYQTKPFSPTELALRVKAVLRRLGEPKVNLENMLKYGNLTLDYTKRTVAVNNSKVELTPKQFELLWLMASNPNRVFTKAHLLDKIWDSSFYGDDNTVTVHIRRLREKVETDPSNPEYIKTVWGMGYKFEYEG
ncbi:two component transcriptional regulator, winged helix family [Desulfofarcimen acetoxidans DSM 771]|uniref:Stage 0 sporulation protein A homolog n=1 Tax=Desulfofarcimen acetoxidans (strain ATCC 49208 / DSM 771 / KCTC 5769 / VKM B-1644 / 5575) TaxID=485916 RepID=C8VW64_DESAS|nr:response regulator transcription factor [Desulfofarcimen acetoxidans]ACV62416.1 two component transcriptional regulator, winged helix family [Desulfofarcimen acetoxidans DSM 771]